MNLPNRLSLFRIILVPITMLVYLFPYQEFGIQIPVFKISFVSLPVINLIVLGLFVVASLTDMLDGMIARKRGLITTFGKFIDPIADKLLTTSLFLCFLGKGIVPVVPVAIMISRDIIVDGIRMIISSKGIVLAAGYLGKMKTVLQMVSIVVILLNNLPFEIYALPISDFILWFATFTSAISGIAYFMQAKNYLLEDK
ncbi:MAG: CDP-diacylglycerol--glycerol-3-phosphate 3-phosphatidyltransferase [Erysipelotrichaceae bacterium]